MQSLAYVAASNQAANASLMTVQTVRAPGATTNTVNTVSGVPTKFYGTMGAPHTFTDPQTGETITVISDATAVDFAGTINAGKIDIVAIAPGYADTRGSLVGDIIVVRPITEWANNIFNIMSQSHNDDGSLKAAAITYNPAAADYVQNGGVWSQVSGLNGTMTAATLWQGGYMGTIAAVASRAFTLSKDTYVDVLRTLSGYTNTFTLVYTEVANGAAAPALAANSIRLAKVITGASAITSVQQFGRDSLYNNIYPQLTKIADIVDGLGALTGKNFLRIGTTLIQWKAVSFTINTAPSPWSVAWDLQFKTTSAGFCTILSGWAMNTYGGLEVLDVNGASGNTRSDTGTLPRTVVMYVIAIGT